MWWIVALIFIAAIIYFLTRIVGSNREAGWVVSENGNPSRIYNGRRVTVFPRDGGWKFCIAELEDDDDPHFSEVYESQVAAETEAMAMMIGDPATYRPIRQIQAELREVRDNQRYSELVLECTTSINEMSMTISNLLESSSPVITKLRPIERKIAKYEKDLDRAIDHFRLVGNTDLLGRCEALRRASALIGSQVAAKIEWLQTTPKRDR
jgi:hypothetical protein